MDNFLQSQKWLDFQKAFGRRVFWLEKEDFKAGIVEHVLPIVGGYFYVPRGPMFYCHSRQSRQGFTEVDEGGNPGRWIPDQVRDDMGEIIKLAKKENTGWIRIEPQTAEQMEIIQKNTEYKIVKAPYDVQPRENFVLDISKSQEQLLAEMKSKTRYNIKLAQKHGVSVQAISDFQLPISKQYVESFLILTREMAARQGIVPHPDDYYRKMCEVFGGDMLRLYAAEHEGKILAANLVLFYGDTATYLHGSSSDKQRNVMAPFLLQWQAISDAKEKGCRWYDFGGIKTKDTRYKAQDTNKWEGITSFKTGFSPNAKPVVFLGSYDIIINPRKYAIYKGLQRAKMIVKKFRH
ncbi:MAG TPA: peptidoglycan bridge formation glycyltransferase FemA/FemB family protein [Candidatus Moranbacteria bacterium]|nr:peptidoglycan bridge formation glycyltransferase FemA/FemB family protein [Candidatus Moranbacteria bacterium]